MNGADTFKLVIEQAGMNPPAAIPPGKMIRFPGAGKSNGNLSGWAKLFDDGKGGVFGDWGSGLSETWQASSTATMTPRKREAQQRNVAEAQRIRQEELSNQHADAARRAQRLWDSAKLAPEDHPYLIKKQVKPHGLRVDDEIWLAIPVMTAGIMTSLQSIGENGEKLFLHGGAVKGGSYAIGVLTGATTILICEGFATGASLYEATGYPVVLAFSANNLTSVSGQLRREHPEAAIILCGDHDLSGTGQREAQKAADAVGGVMCLPETEGHDFNDVHVDHGLDAVRTAIEVAINLAQENQTMTTTIATKESEPDRRLNTDNSFLAYRVGGLPETNSTSKHWENASNSIPSPSGLPETNFNPKLASDLLAEVPEPTEWILEDFLALGSLALIAGKPKEGKTTLVYELCVKMARGQTFLGRTTRKGGVLILAVEEHQRDVRMRLHNLGAEGLDNLYINVGALIPTPTFFAGLLAWIQAHDIRLVVVDTLAAFWSVQNENDASEMTRAVKPLLQLARASDACILLIHHARKSEGSHGDEIRGSGALFGLVDIAIIMKRHSVETQRLLQTQSRYPETPAELVLELRDTGYVALGDPAAVGKADKMRRLQSAVTENPEETEALAKKAWLSRRDATRLLDLLLKNGAIVRDGQGKKGDPYRFAQFVSGNPPVPRDASKQEYLDSFLATPNASVPPARNESGLPCETDDNLYADGMVEEEVVSDEA